MRAYATNHVLLNSAKLQVPLLLKLWVPGTDMLLLMPPSSSVPRTLLSKIQEPVYWYIVLLINLTLWNYLFTEVNYRYFVSVGYLKTLYNNLSQWSQTSRDDNRYGVQSLCTPKNLYSSNYLFKPTWICKWYSKPKRLQTVFLQVSPGVQLF